MNFFSPYDKNRPLRVICRAGNRPEITVISTIDQHLTCSDDLDPDLHFNTNSRCDYFNEDKFNNILSKDGQSDSNFSILHLNVRSLQNKVDYLTLLLANLFC